MKKTALLYDDIYLRHATPHGHPERKERLIAIIDALRRSNLWDKLIHIAPRKATFEDIGAVHTKKYIEHIKTIGVGYADPDTYLCPETLDAALYAAGAVIEAIDRIRQGQIERAFCAVRPPGHHAEADRAMGFCIFNNVAVGARYAQSAGFKRVYIVDFDVHHGNGTQHIFEDDPTVFYFSSHQYPHYPGTGDIYEQGTGAGKGFTSNHPMQAGSGDKDFFHVYHDELHSSLVRFKPDIILVSAGYDIHYRDPLAGLRVSAEGIGTIVKNILEAVDAPAVFCLEGGYDLEALAESVTLTIKLMLET